MRPYQWTKNGCVFLGILFGLFAGEVHDLRIVLPVVVLFVSFCFLSSSVYLFNDIRDREDDRAHPVKCRRPIAAGRLSVRTAALASVVLAVSSLLLVEATGWVAPALGWDLAVRKVQLGLLAYLGLNLAYTARLKQVAIADVTSVAIGFLIRVVAGPALVQVDVSLWLILCTFFGALFLAIAKRRGELFQSETAGTDGRQVLRQYTATTLDILMAMGGTTTLICYSLYTVSPDTLRKFGTHHLMYTIPFVFLGLGRYLILLYRDHEGEDPASLLFRDKGVLCAIAGWLLACTAAVWLSPA